MSKRNDGDCTTCRRGQSHRAGEDRYRRGQSHRTGEDRYRRGQSHRTGEDRYRRGQSHVVGVALLLAITTVSLGALTAGVGTVVESNAAAVDADRTADALAGLDPSEATGAERHELAFGEGRLTVEPRTARLLDGGGVVASHRADALVFETGERRVSFLAGAVTRGEGNASRLTDRPPLATDEGLLLVGLPVLNASRGPGTVAGGTGVTLRLRTDTHHERRRLDAGHYRLAVETSAPGAWESYFARQNATTSRRDFDGDGVPSVVAAFPGDRSGYLVVHDARLEVAR